jgi:hypothetical protein
LLSGTNFVAICYTGHKKLIHYAETIVSASIQNIKKRPFGLHRSISEQGVQRQTYLLVHLQGLFWHKDTNTLLHSASVEKSVLTGKNMPSKSQYNLFHLIV